MKEQIYRLQLEKTRLIGTLIHEYPLKDFLENVGMARSSYFYQRKIVALPDKYESLRHLIIHLFIENNRCYKYRRIYKALGQAGIYVSEKVIQQIIADYQLVAVSKTKMDLVA